jgi:hypothetical protein
MVVLVYFKQWGGLEAWGWARMALEMIRRGQGSCLAWEGWLLQVFKQV